MAKILAGKGLKYVVISPGSRSAPLVIAFNRMSEFTCLPIVDERSAAFFALGMAQQLQEPVALICTSGSAVLNYGPAIAEAFYQKIPLLVITADRPWESIDQGENQSIVQFDIFRNFIKKSFELPLDIHQEKDLSYSNRLVNEAYNVAMGVDKGPIHINVPLREPLYTTVESGDIHPKLIHSSSSNPILDEAVLLSLKEKLNNVQKIWIVVGSMPVNAALNAVLDEVSKLSHIVVLTENISNLRNPNFVDCIDPLIEIIDKKDRRDLVPELIITIGGGLISKKIKFLLRNKSIQQHWHVSMSEEHWDNFDALTETIVCDPIFLLSQLLLNKPMVASDFVERHRNLLVKIEQCDRDFISNLPFCDFRVFDILWATFPLKANIQLGNSTPVRYANLLHLNSNFNGMINSNRGVSGIDGIISTAAGAAYIHRDQLNICIVGDIAFMYDSNAWWNNHLNENFKCIVINNGGGNIFKIIPGPDALEECSDYFETAHHRDLSLLAQHHQVNYHTVSDETALRTVLPLFYSEKNGRPSIMEIKTPSNSAQYLRDYFKSLPNSLN